MILESQIRALDTAIQSLDGQISTAKDTRVNEPFRESWRAFTSRWQIQRDEWLGAGSITRKLGFAESRYEAFKTAFQKWQANFQKRIAGSAATPPPARPEQRSTPLFGNLFAGTGTALVITALVVSGFLFINQRRK